MCSPFNDTLLQNTTVALALGTRLQLFLETKTPILGTLHSKRDLAPTTPHARSSFVAAADFQTGLWRGRFDAGQVSETDFAGDLDEFLYVGCIGILDAHCRVQGTPHPLYP